MEPYGGKKRDHNKQQPGEFILPNPLAKSTHEKGGGTLQAVIFGESFVKYPGANLQLITEGK